MKRLSVVLFAVLIAFIAIAITVPAMAFDLFGGNMSATLRAEKLFSINHSVKDIGYSKIDTYEFTSPREQFLFEGSLRWTLPTTGTQSVSPFIDYLALTGNDINESFGIQKSLLRVGTDYMFTKNLGITAAYINWMNKSGTIETNSPFVTAGIVCKFE